MNICFILGKVVSDIEFNFLCKNKIISIAKCKVELSNKSIIEIYGYNKNADYLYSKVTLNDNILVEGKLCKYKIEVSNIYNLDSKIQIMSPKDKGRLVFARKP